MYDMVINFIGAEAQIGHAYQTTTQQKTGYSGDQDILRNIYDLEGNNKEWTALSYGSSIRSLRGGDFSVENGALDGRYWPASYRDTYKGVSAGGYSYFTSRNVLYL